MIFKSKKKEEFRQEDNFLLFVQHIKHNDWIDKKGSIFLIFHYNHPIQKAVNWLVKKPNTSDLKLDDLGSTVWKSIDGKRNVKELGDVLVDTFGEGCQPVYERLIMFLRYMNRRGWIYFENVIKADK